LSFSSDIKEELSRNPAKLSHCLRAELAAILDICGSVEETPDSYTLSFHFTQGAVARRTYRILAEEFRLPLELPLKPVEHRQRKKSKYVVQVSGKEECSNLLRQLHPDDTSLPLITRDCCRQAYLRGAFLAGGSMSDPKRQSYHLELVLESPSHAAVLCQVLRHFHINPGQITRKGSQVVYLKDRKGIGDLLTRMGAMRQRLLFEDATLKKDLHNETVRSMNSMMHNDNKSWEAGMRQCDAITWLQKEHILPQLSPELQQVAKARLEEPGFPLQDIADQLSLGKSAVNHRLRKLEQIAKTSGWVPKAISFIK